MCHHFPCRNRTTLNAARVRWPSTIASQMSLGSNPHSAWRKVHKPIGMAGKKLADTGSPQTDIQSVSLSPDGTRAAYEATEQGNSDVWIVDLTRSTRFTFGPERNYGPSWTRSGREIAFSSARRSRRDILVQPSDGSGEPKAVVSSPLSQFTGGWSPDSTQIGFAANGELKKIQITGGMPLT